MGCFTHQVKDKMMGGEGEENPADLCVHMELKGSVFSGLSFASITAKRKMTYIKIY